MSVLNDITRISNSDDILKYNKRKKIRNEKVINNDDFCLCNDEQSERGKYE